VTVKVITILIYEMVNDDVSSIILKLKPQQFTAHHPSHPAPTDSRHGSRHSVPVRHLGLGSVLCVHTTQGALLYTQRGHRCRLAISILTECLKWCLMLWCRKVCYIKCCMCVLPAITILSSWCYINSNLLSDKTSFRMFSEIVIMSMVKALTQQLKQFWFLFFSRIAS